MERVKERTIEVAGGSMRPLIPVGARVRVVSCEPEEIRVGDIALFRHGRSLIVHRVVELRREGETIRFAERGDAALTVRWRDRHEFVGRVVGVRQSAGNLNLQRGLGRRLASWMDADWILRRAPWILRHVGYRVTEAALGLYYTCAAMSDRLGFRR